MEFLQKTPQCIFHLTTAILLQHLGTCSVVSEPTLRLLRAGGRVQHDTSQHQPVAASEHTRLLCDPEIPNLGAFGPKHISLYPHAGN